MILDAVDLCTPITSAAALIKHPVAKKRSARHICSSGGMLQFLEVSGLSCSSSQMLIVESHVLEISIFRTVPFQKGLPVDLNGL